MLDNQLSIDYAGTAVTLTRVSEQNYSSDYFGESGDMKFSMSISHTIPGRGQPGESHLVRLDVEHYDTDGVFLRQSSAWTVVKTFTGVQDSQASSATAEALNGLLSDTVFLERIVSRES